MTNDIRLIVLTYDSEKDIQDCLDSLTFQMGTKHEIFVTDNASRDNTPSLVSNNYPSLKLIQNPDNYGYSKGNNISLESPLPEFVAFINPDTLSAQDWVAEAVRVLKSNPKIGAVQPRIMLFDDRTKLNSQGNEANFLFFAWPEGYGKSLNSQDTHRRIAFASGCAAVYRSECLEIIGHFDESFFMYGEDTDLGMRLFLAGYDTMYCPDGVIYHKYRFKESGWKYQLLERNRLMILLKTYRKKTLLALLPIMAVSELGVILKARSEGWLTHKIRSYGGVIRRLPILLNNRKKLQTIRVRSDSELISLLKGAITFSPLNSSSSLKKGNELLDKYREFLIQLRI